MPSKGRPRPGDVVRTDNVGVRHLPLLACRYLVDDVFTRGRPYAHVHDQAVARTALKVHPSEGSRGLGVAMKRVVKRAVCFVRSHRWTKRRYAGADTDEGYYLHCLRCGKDNHHAGGPSTGMGGAGFGAGAT